LLCSSASLTSCSSGEIFDPQPANVGIHCRNSLIAISTSGHTAVFNRKLLKEWNDHPSRFSQRWLGEMVLTGKILPDAEGDEHSSLLERACTALTTEKEAFAKDFHLVRSALATGQLIVSIERRFPQIVSVASKAVLEFRQLYYANPDVEGDPCIVWIKDGAEKIEDRRIDVWAAKVRRGG